MSHSTVRAQARAVVAAIPPWPATAPYQDGIGKSPAPETLPASWSSIFFEPYSDEAIGIGPSSEWRETGRIVFRVGAESGQGDTTLISIAESAVTAILAWDWGSAAIFIISVAPPKIDEEAGEGRFLVADIEVEYEHDHVV